MALYFEKVSLLGLTQEFKQLGAGFNYANIKQFSIQGNVTDLHNVVGVIGILSGVATTTSNFYNYQPIILNGVNFGDGRVESLNFVAGTDVQLDQYTATLSTFNQGDLSNLAGLNYPSIDITNWELIDNFTENYSFNRKENGGYSYVHTANIQFFKGPSDINAINQAKALASSLFVGSALGFVFYPAGTATPGKRYYKETYDIITNACAFEETLDFDHYDTTYSAIYNDSIELGADGIVNVTENGIVRGITDPNFTTAANGFQAVIAGALSRCSNLITEYAPIGQTFQPLLTTQLSQSINYNLFIGEITYTIVFTNDPKYFNTYFWSYTTEQTQQNGYFNAVENGNIIGKATDRPTAYDNAVAGAAIAIPGVATRIANLPNSAGGYYQVATSRSDSPFKGVISYSTSFSNKPVLGGGSSQQIAVEIEDDTSVYQWNKFGIFNIGNILQDGDSSLPQKRRVNLTVFGVSNADISDYKSAVNGVINNYKLNGGFVTQCNYEFNPNQNTLSFNTEWLVAGSAGKGINV